MDLLNQITRVKILEDVESWISKIVVGLNLCPFAKQPFVKKIIRYSICTSTEKFELIATLKRELHILAEANPMEVETTLLIHPNIFANFLDQNDFLYDSNQILGQLNMEGLIQIANFHPNFQFAHRNKDDITNYVNRAPYPILHLLREESVSQAVEKYDDMEMIYKNNMKKLRKLGYEEVQRLFNY